VAVIAMRVADLVSPADPRPGVTDGAGGGRHPKIRTGSAGVREGGRGRRRWSAAAAQAGGDHADHARLGALEQQLDELLGPGVIDEIGAKATLAGKVKGRARPAITAALTIRASVLTMLLPDAGYDEVMAALAGDLVLVPWRRPYQVPTAKVLSAWRTLRQAVDS
jgi:hypothetical protein